MDNKEQIKDKLKEFINYAREEEEGVTDDDIYMFMDDVFPPGKGGMLSDAEILNAYAEWLLETNYMGGEVPEIQKHRVTARAQHALDQQHEANALKEQMERIFRAIEAEQSDYGKENEGYKALERVKLALKAELEGK